MDIEEAKQLKVGEVLHTTYPTWPKCGSGKSNRWKVNGKVKTWKRDPSRVSVPVKHGLYSYDTLTEDTLHMIHKESECPYGP